MSEPSNAPQLTESSTMPQVYECCPSYGALLEHPDRPRLGVITDLLNRIRTYKSQHHLPTLEAAYDAHRRYVFQHATGKRKRATIAEGAFGAVDISVAKRAAVTETEPLLAPSTAHHERNETEHKLQQRIEDLESKYSALESKHQQCIEDLESRYQALEGEHRQRLDDLEHKVKPIEWQPDNRLPRRINRGFTILAELGMGQRAVVYECVNRSTNTHVALKVARDPGEPNVVRNDALFIHRIGWRYLIRFHGSSESLNDPSEMQRVDAIEMRLFQSTLKSDLLAFDCGRRKERTPRWCLQHFDGLLTELATWHAKGVVHSDVKPDNVAWSEDEQRYVLIDFGHAISADDHVVVKRGTMAYTAPEALGCYGAYPKGQRLATKGDVWSLGLTLMYVCSRKPRRAVFRVDDCRDEGERRAKVSASVTEYLHQKKDDRKHWLRQQLHIEEPEIMSSMVDLLAAMLCEPESRWEVDAVRKHKFWSLVRT